MREIMKYDQGRMLDALAYSGIPKETLDDYVERTSDINQFYRFDELKSKYGYQKPDDITEIHVLRRKYLSPDEKGPLFMWDRNARAIASVEPIEKQEYWYKEFMSILKDFKFVPGGRIMHGAGRTDVRREPTLSNCYVIPITWGWSQDKFPYLSRNIQDTLIDAVKTNKSYRETFSLLETKLTRQEIKSIIFPPDSLEGIYQNLAEAAQVYRTGGGVGTDLSALRPRDASVGSTIDKAPGITAFMNLLSESTETVAQSNRRGALMLTLRVDHPDIEYFINVKNDANRSKVKHANISVLLTHEFMKAVENNSEFTLKWPYHQNQTDSHEVITKKVKAKDIWNKIIKSAHASAEPGLIFWDTMKDYHNVESKAPLESTNPCGEQPLASYTACNLGNINLSRFVDESGNFDYVHLGKVASTATRFMDDVIEYNKNNHALEKIKKAVEADRRTGLGITGLADALIMMHVKYDSKEGLDATEKIMQTIRDSSYKTSIELAKERGAFPLFSWEEYSKSKFVENLPDEIRNEIKKYGIRNGTLITMPPVGTGSIVAEVAGSGIEPVYDLVYNRRVKQNEGGDEKTFEMVAPIVRKLFADTKEFPSYVVTAHNIDPIFRVKMQSVIQKYVDTSISSTINLSKDVSLETVASIYMNSYKMGLKGVTVYRETSREGVLQTKEFTEKKNESLEKLIEIEKPKVIDERKSSATYGIGTGDGKLHITITGNEKGYPSEVFANLGPIGSGRSTSTLVDGLRLTRYLQEAQEPDLLQILKDYGSAKSDSPVGFGPNRVDSIQHGFSIIWRYHLLKNGVVTQNGEQGLKQLIFKNGKSNDPKTDSKNEEVKNTSENQGAPCLECGSRNTKMVNGCREPTCLDCGASKCG